MKIRSRIDYIKVYGMKKRDIRGNGLMYKNNVTFCEKKRKWIKMLPMNWTGQ
jgi:hypothetical protein